MKYSITNFAEHISVPSETFAYASLRGDDENGQESRAT